jgi:hypothetical protein
MWPQFGLADGGRCVAFNPTDETMFLVGTDEGLIYKCTTEYSSRSDWSQFYDFLIYNYKARGPFLTSPLAPRDKLHLEW